MCRKESRKGPPPVFFEIVSSKDCRLYDQIPCGKPDSESANTPVDCTWSPGFGEAPRGKAGSPLGTIFIFVISHKRKLL